MSLDNKKNSEIYFRCQLYRVFNRLLKNGIIVGPFFMGRAFSADYRGKLVCYALKQNINLAAQALQHICPQATIHIVEAEVGSTGEN